MHINTESDTTLDSQIDLKQASIGHILAGQHTSGAYVASPTFSQYGYSWLRDGVWIAYGMTLAGKRESADAFYRWTVNTLVSQHDRIDHLLTLLAEGKTPSERDYLPTRFTLDGTLGSEDWPDFQLDGYGAWLWGFANHCADSDDPLWQTGRDTVARVVRYVEALWQSPNYDCWEEHRMQIHPATLAALYGGLCAVRAVDPDLVTTDVPEQIRAFVLEKCVTEEGHFCKFVGNPEVDASLLWISVPYRLVEVDHPAFQATLKKIESDLAVRHGGVYRYRADTYFGGGEWLILAAWLAWTYTYLNRREEARMLFDWIAAQADTAGHLPEQTADHLLQPDFYPQWVARWGDPANPLLWSHAMYLILDHVLSAPSTAL